MKKRVVILGGGSGSFTVLKGLKAYPFDLTAGVNIFDSGGSAGILRDELGELPKGDVRRALVALADNHILRELFNYRFESTGSLSNHNFGNIFLSALTKLTGNEVEAIREASKLLSIRGKVLPISIDRAELCARLRSGQIIRGETNIDVPKHDGNIAIEEVYLDPSATIYAETYDAIVEANLVVICPGDLYTSIVPNLLVKGCSEALESTKAMIVYVCNIMTKWGETNDFTASMFAREVLKYSKLARFDYILCNQTSFSKDLLRRYQTEQKCPVEIDEGIKGCADKVLVEDISLQADIIRHDSTKLARTLSGLVL